MGEQELERTGDSLATRLTAAIGTSRRVEVRDVDGVPVPTVVEHDLADPKGRADRMAEHLLRAHQFSLSEEDAVTRVFDAYEAHPGDGRTDRPFIDLMIDSWGGDPVQRAEAALIRRSAEASHGGLYMAEALRRKLARFEAELLGGRPTAIERVVVDSIGCAWIDAMSAEERAAETTAGSVALFECLERRKEKATARLLKGLKTLDAIRRGSAPGVAIQVNVGSPPDRVIEPNYLEQNELKT